MSDQEKTDALEAALPSDLDSVLEPRTSDYSEQPESTGVAQVVQSPAFSVIATAYDLHGREPRRVIEFEHAAGHRVRRLLPEGVFTSATRARTALIKAGVSLGSATADSLTVFDVAMTRPDGIGMYGIPCGWSHGQDAGPIYRFGDKAYSSSGPIPVYVEGPVPAGMQTDDLALLKKVLTTDLSSCSVILVAAHLASLLVPLLGCDPIAIVASGVAESDEAHIRSLADSAFGTKMATWPARLHASDSTLVQLSTAKSRKQAFQQVCQFSDVASRTERRIEKFELTPAPVALVVTGEPDIPRSLALPSPPTGSIEIPFDKPQMTVIERVTQSAPVAIQHFGAVAAKTFIDAVLRDPGTVIRHADSKMPKFASRYLGTMKGNPCEDAVRIAASTFALLRYALTCGRQFGVVPWEGEAVDAVMDACVTRWSERHRDRKLAFERHVINAVKKLTDPGMENRRAKPIDREITFETVKGRELMLIESRTFDTHIVSCFDKTRVLDALRKRHLLVTNGDGAQYQKRIDGGRARFYAIDVARLRTP
ncbi:hypothetical protein DF118_06115 [Burkholderia stagnalis]|uniref:hypothetical protein n=1 Tax=Burkholderia stagnalis TaxID=1503054 RepID=UPI000F5D126A|nr:hypothetical protein [Burkholderia stagnalis]RQY16665.1 hypothetical protein DF118_06115 [Burkholderia stagnalis]